eukprot:1188820-Prorocentrum_minimum.AAC.1
MLRVSRCSFLDVARPPSRDPPPGDRLPGARFARTDLKSGRASERGRATNERQGNLRPAYYKFTVVGSFLHVM